MTGTHFVLLSEELIFSLYLLADLKKIDIVINRNLPHSRFFTQKSKASNSLEFSESYWHG